MRTRFLLLAVVAVFVALGPGPGPAHATLDPTVARQPGDLAARGAFTCDFALAPTRSPATSRP